MSTSDIRWNSGRLRFLSLLSLFFALMIGTLIILAVLFVRNNRAFNKGSDLITHTRLVVTNIDSVLLLAQNLQWHTRNFAVTGDSNVYSKYADTRQQLLQNSDELKQLVSDNPYQYANAVKLSQQITDLIHFTDSSIQARGTINNLQASRLPNVLQHIKMHDALERQVTVIEAEEKRLLALRRDAVLENIQTSNRIFLVSGAFVFLVLAGTFSFVFDHFQRRIKAEKKLRESEHRFKALINSTSDLAIFSIDDKGRILDWYGGAQKIKGYCKDEVIGKNIAMFYTEEAIIDGEPERNLATAAKQGSFETEGWRVRKDKSRFWADVLISAIYDEDGELTGFTKVTRDFSIHKKAEDETRRLLQKEKELSQMKSSFVSMASHEFRTPLSTIMSSISLLESYKTTETQEKRDRHITRIKASVKELVSTLEEFLSLEKIESGKTYVRNESFNLRNLAEQMKTKFAPLLKNGQTVEYHHIGSENVVLDQGLLIHILTNLLSNAVKYSHDSTAITFDTYIDTHIIRITIKDHGIGISEEDQQHLFSRFFRASNTDGIKGTGLGLHIVKRFVDLMDGNISVKSELNKGTEFDITFRVPSQTA